MAQASSSSFVTGAVKKVGNAAFKFPVGYGTTYKPISISAPGTTTDAYTAQYYNTGLTNTLGGVLTYADPCRVPWSLAHTTGSSTVHDTLFWNSPCFYIASLSYFKIGYVSGSTLTSAGTCTTTGNTTTGSIAGVALGNLTLAKTNPIVYAHAAAIQPFAEAQRLLSGASPAVTGGTSPFNYSWSPASGLSSSTAANPMATPTVTTTYILTVTDNLTEYGRDTVVVTVHTNPAASAGSDVRLCKRFPATLGSSPTASSGTSPYKYLWTNNSGDTTSVSANPTVIADTTRTFYLLVTDTLGCIGRDTMQVTVNPAMQVKAGPDTTLFMGQSVSLSSTVTDGTSPFTYSWSPKIWLNDSTIANPTCHSLSTTHYALLVTDSFGCNDEAFLTINYQPFNLGDLSNYTVFAADSINAADSTFAYGSAASKYINSYLYMRGGDAIDDTGIVYSLKNNLSSVISGLNSLTAGGTALSGTLSGATLTSGLYHISSKATLNGTLTLSGNDSSFILLNMDSDFVINDSSHIVLNGISSSKIYINVSGQVQAGNGVLLQGTLLSGKNISLGSYLGMLTPLSLGTIKFNAPGDRTDGGGPDGKGSDCYAANASTEHVVVMPPPNVPVDGPPDPTDYLPTPVFDEEFTEPGSVLDITTDYSSIPNHKWYQWGGWGSEQDFVKWVDYLGQGANGDYYIDPTSHYLVLQDTKLQTPFTATSAKGNTVTYQYSNAEIRTSAEFRHGYFEIKAKLPPGQGEWPAFWLFEGGCGGTSGVEDDDREIDFFDGYMKKTQLPIAQFYHQCSGEVVTNELCFQYANGNPYNLATEPDFGGWHIYGCDWNADNITWYIDGIQIGIYTFDKTQQNELASRDERMYVVLGTGDQATTNDFPRDATAGVPGPPGSQQETDRDFIVQYVKVWQKEGDYIGTYITDENTGTIVDPTTTQLCVGNCYDLQTNAYYPTVVNQVWTSTSGIEPQPGVEGGAWNPDFHFCVTEPGPQSISLNENLFIYPSYSIEGETDINTLQLGTPTVYLNSIPGSPYGCGFSYCVDAVPDAGEYQWSFTNKFSSPDFESSGLCYGDFSIYNFTAYPYFYPIAYAPPIYVRAETDNSCVDLLSPVTYYPGGYATVSCAERLEDTSRATKPKIDSISNLVKAYPSPSDGHLWIENGLNEKIVVTLKTISGVTVSTLILNKGEKSLLNNLAEGMIIMEGERQSDHEIVLRRMIPVINP